MEHEDLDELAGEIRRLIESNKEFLKRVVEEDYDDDEEEADDEEENPEDPEDFEEL
ncbi:hypothetical protein [Geomonas subterranea]|uniref:Phage protein n=1 Tax=Geomonas subterranea TaxID=2847989 RepID=A0ABX8LG04_9BACT|nr:MULTISPECIES: hypothetical protein [Geomonas]QXE90643.1 hypothetical protein KP001_19950 [Geomonas subterranea]QXM11277.1 hypothetical protein KP002_09335 [Geomonas subterranea]